MDAQQTQQCVYICHLPVQMPWISFQKDTSEDVRGLTYVVPVSNFLSSFPPLQAELHNSCGEQLPNVGKEAAT